MAPHIPLARRTLAAATSLIAALVLLLGTAPAVTAVPAAHVDYLDVVEDNPDGEFAGGFSSQLPTGRAELRAALDSARAAGLDPRRYSSLTRQYWLAVAADNAGIDLDDWEPARGLIANLDTVDRVYINYLRLGQHDGFYWVGMAGLAGLSFAAGFWDLDEIGGLLTTPGVHDLGTALGGTLDGMPWEIVEQMPGDVRTLAANGPRLQEGDIEWYLHRLLIKQRNIFMDMVPMHEAYKAEGLTGVQELLVSPAYDDYIREAWRRLDSGTREGRADALLRMASREQNQIIADQWDETAAGRGKMGRVLTYVTTIGGAPDVPGASALAEFRPLTVQANVGGNRVAVSTPLPAFNWADREPRWDYIEQDLVPAYRSLIQDRPAEAQAALSIPFRPVAERSRILNRLPDFIAQMTSGWLIAPV